MKFINYYWPLLVWMLGFPVIRVGTEILWGYAGDGASSPIARSYGYLTVYVIGIILFFAAGVNGIGTGGKKP